MNDIKNFGRFIKEKRIEKNLTQKELAELVFVSESACSKWEIGKSYPDITRIPLLSKALGISEQELITAADDLEFQKLNKDAARWNNLVDKCFRIPTICYITAFVICLICNIAVNHALTWSLTVFFSLLVAFTFVPTVLKFVKRHKLLWFCITTYASMTMLFANCVIQYGGSWFGVTELSVLLGYFGIFGPFVLNQINCGKYRKWNLLIFFTAMFVILIPVLACCSIQVFKSGLQIALFCWIPLFFIGVNHVLSYNTLYKAASDVFIFVPFLYGLNTVISKSLHVPVVPLKIDFSNWVNCSNGNVYLIIAICLFCISTALVIMGICKKKKGSAL